MSIRDVIKNSVYESLGGGTQLSTYAIFFTLIAAAFIGIYIFAVYKLSSKSAFYSRDLNVTIAGMPIVVAAIMIAMQSNLIVSLGMVGALSIVRFRNAVKNPLDLLYLFWAVSTGIICGVGLKVLALALCIVLTVLILLLQMVPNLKTPSILVLRTTTESLDGNQIKELLKNYGKAVKEKSRNYRGGETEFIFELTTSREEEMLKELRELEGVNQVSFLAHDGEYRI